jgi:hypothetical protein
MMRLIREALGSQQGRRIVYKEGRQEGRGIYFLGEGFFIKRGGGRERGIYFLTLVLPSGRFCGFCRSARTENFKVTLSFLMLNIAPGGA